MKSERRHELQQNMLGQWLADTWEWLKKKSNYLVWGLFVVAVIVAVAAFWHRHNVKQDVEFQSQWQAAQATGASDNLDETAKTLDAMIKDDSNRDRAGTAALWLANSYAVRSLVEKSPADRDAARDNAKKYYNLVIGTFDKQPMKVAKAHIGLARLAEGKGDYAAAKDEYQKVIDMPGLADAWPVAWSMDAQKKLEQLKSQVVILATTLPTSEPSPQGVAATTTPGSMPSTRPGR